MAQTILIVEDNEDNRVLFVDVLAIHGYDITTAINGKEGVRLARQMMPDLILMDIQMPVMDGITAASILKADQATSGLKIIALTSFAMRGDEEKFLAAGFNGYLCKPINTRELPDLVRVWLQLETKS
jgi:two-component system cell cycle response regulator DivK